MRRGERRSTACLFDSLSRAIIPAQLGQRRAFVCFAVAERPGMQPIDAAAPDPQGIICRLPQSTSRTRLQTITDRQSNRDHDNVRPDTIGHSVCGLPETSVCNGNTIAGLDRVHGKTRCQSRPSVLPWKRGSPGALRRGSHLRADVCGHDCRRLSQQAGCWVSAAPAAPSSRRRSRPGNESLLADLPPI